MVICRPIQIPVYNLTVEDEKKRTWKWIMDVGRDLGLKVIILQKV